MDRIALLTVLEFALGTGFGAVLAWFFTARHFRYQIGPLVQSLKHWQDRHAAMLEEANRAWVAMEELMVNRLGYTHQAASDAIHVWRTNGYGKPRLGGAEIVPGFQGFAGAAPIVSPRFKVERELAKRNAKRARRKLARL